jgi:ABC-type uncharacterized transport system fused permease/ATPase subunit
VFLIDHYSNLLLQKGLEIYNYSLKISTYFIVNQITQSSWLLNLFIDYFQKVILNLVDFVINFLNFGIDSQFMIVLMFYFIIACYLRIDFGFNFVEINYLDPRLPKVEKYLKTINLMLVFVVKIMKKLFVDQKDFKE